MPGRAPSKPGLQSERTLLSWERSALGFLVGGALVLLRQHGPLGPGRTVLALTAALLALVVLGLGYRRSRQITASPVIAGRLVLVAPRAEVLVLGGATVSFSTAIVVALLLSA
jgi:putative membrane protein